MGRLIDLTGQKFGKLLVIKRGENGKDNSVYWWCKCDCKKTELVLKRGNDLKSGKVTSCGCVLRHDNIVGIEKLNYQGSLMKCIEYKDYKHVVVEFVDKYHYQTVADYERWEKGNIKNVYVPSVQKVGILGNKYSTRDKDGNVSKEYNTWKKMMERCFNEKQKENIQPIKMQYVVKNGCCLKIFTNGYMVKKITKNGRKVKDGKLIKI